jgi:uncharacterized protein with gpF-like domain
VERLRNQLDAKYIALFANAIDKDLKKFIVMLKKNGPQATRSMMGSYVWNEEIFTIMQALYKEAAILFGNASYRTVGIMSRKASNPFGLNLDWINEMLAFLTKFGLQLVANMTNTTKVKIDTIISLGISQGLSSDEIAKMIMEDEELGYAKMRATRIARTEVMRASNYAAFVGASKHDFLVDKIWIATRDSRTRRIPKDYYDHWDMDGQVVAFNENFTSRDKLGRPVIAEIPGDPKSPKGFTINCRCTVGFIPKRDANGRLILKQ